MAIVFQVQQLLHSLEEEVRAEAKVLGRLCLASVLIGSDHASQVYCASQKRLAQKLDIGYLPVALKRESSFQTLRTEIQLLNNDSAITGIIINKPLPRAFREEDVYRLLAENKDVEGMHPVNLGRLSVGNKTIDDVVHDSGEHLLLSPTVRSIVHILTASGLGELRGKRVVLVGFSSLIGKPLCLLLANALATVSITHIGTSEAGDLPEYIRAADIVISAAGVPGLIQGSWIKHGSILIDVGTGSKDGKLCGDIQFEEAKQRAAFITPVPGGVGKLTPLFLYYNVILAAKRNKAV